MGAAGAIELAGNIPSLGWSCHNHQCDNLDRCHLSDCRNEPIEKKGGVQLQTILYAWNQFSSTLEKVFNRIDTLIVHDQGKNKTNRT